MRIKESLQGLKNDLNHIKETSFLYSYNNQSNSTSEDKFPFFYTLQIFSPPRNINLPHDYLNHMTLTQSTSCSNIKTP